MDRTAEVTIIGAGVIGTSIAYHLAKMGCHNVVILEKDYLGSGSTSKCAGGIRQQFSTKVNIQLSIESIRFFKHFEEETGHPNDFRQRGYLILATTKEEQEALRQSATQQGKLGLEVYLLSPEEAKEIVPQLNTEDVLCASYCPTDGYADPYSVVQGFASAARRLGVKIYEQTEVIGVEVVQHQVRRVLTNRGKVETRVLVNAAGAYAGKIGQMVGIDIPIRPSRRHIFVTAPLDEIPKEAPMVIELHNGLWFRKEGPSLIFGMRNPDEPESFNTSVDWGFLAIIAEVVSHRLPFLVDIGIMRGQAGLHTDTPDYHAILGEVPGLEGLILACGFSGHGFMHSPAVGRLTAELILKGEPSLDISPLAFERFKSVSFQEERIFI